MNQSIRFASLLLATGFSSVALITLLNVAALAGFTISEVTGAIVALSLVAFSIADYSRETRPLQPSATPRSIPNATITSPRPRSVAYGLPRSPYQPRRRIAA